MNEILQLASAALAANDADQLELLCTRAQGLPPFTGSQAEVTTGMRSLQRQLSGAQKNIALRRRLLEMHTGEASAWAR